MVLLLAPQGCITRSYSESSLLTPRSLESVYAIKPAAEAWQNAIVLQVIAPDTFRVRLAQGKGEVTVSLFALRAQTQGASRSSRGARERALDFVMPGDAVTVEPVSRSENGRLFVKMRTLRHPNLGVALTEAGLLVPAVSCRSFDVCTPAVLDVLGVNAAAQACESQKSASDAASPQEPVAPFSEGPASRWVGDVRDLVYVPADQRERIPFCRRISFSGRTMTEDVIRRLGFVPASE